MSFPETLTKTQPAADPSYFLLLKKNEIQTESFPLQFCEDLESKKTIKMGRNGSAALPPGMSHQLQWEGDQTLSTGDAGGSCSEEMV